MRNRRKFRFNRAQILLAIRTNPSIHFDELIEKFLLEEFFMSSSEDYLGHGLKEILARFNSAGLIEIDSNHLISVTSKLKNIQSALGISLNELAQQGADSMSVTPIFGSPEVNIKGFPSIFVLMPFSNKMLPIYEDHIKSLQKKLTWTLVVQMIFLVPDR